MFSVIASAAGTIIFALLLEHLRNSFQRELVSVDGRQKFSDALKSIGSEKYSILLSGALDQVDKGLSPSKYKQRSASQISIAWSAGAMRLSLRLAVLYPILFMLTQWAVLGSEIAIAGHPILPEQESVEWRLGVLLIFLVTIVFFPSENDYEPVFGAQEDTKQQLELELETGTDTGAGSKAPSSGLKTVLVPLLLFIAVLAFEGSSQIIVGFLAIVLATRVSGLVAVSLTVPIALFVSNQMSWFFPITIVITIAFVLQSRIGQRLRRPLLAICLYLLFLLLFLVVWLEFAANPNDGTAILVTLIAVFPILNTLFDFLSIGLTRACLRLGILERRPAFYGLLDVIMGSLIFLLLLSTMIAFFHYIRTASGDPILPVAEFLLDTGDRATSQTWFYASLATTLVPTILHAFFAFVVATPLLKLPLIGQGVEWAANAFGSNEQDQVNWAFTAGVALLVVTFAVFLWVIAEVALMVVPSIFELSPVFQNFIAVLIEFITGETANSI